MVDTADAAAPAVALSVPAVIDVVGKVDVAVTLLQANDDTRPHGPREPNRTSHELLAVLPLAPLPTVEVNGSDSPVGICTGGVGGTCTAGADCDNVYAIANAEVANIECTENGAGNDSTGLMALGQN